jgi:hypothetical protein
VAVTSAAGARAIKRRKQQVPGPEPNEDPDRER